MGNEQRKRKRVGVGRDSGWIKWIVALAIAAYILKVWFGLSGRGSHRRPPRRPPATNVYPEQAPQVHIEAPQTKGPDDYPRGEPVSQPPPRPSPTAPAPADPKATSTPAASFVPSGSEAKQGKGSEVDEQEPSSESGVPGYGRPLPKATPYSPPGYHTKPSNAGAPTGY